MMAAASFYYHPQTFTQISLTHYFGRDVTVGHMDVAYDPLVITLKDVAVANASGGTQPAMFTAGHVVAELEFGSLLGGTVVCRRLTVDNARLLLEHDADGVGNWKLNGLEQAQPDPQIAAAQSRKDFPTFRELALRDSGVVFITSRDSKINVDLNDARLLAADDEQPILHVQGAYQDIPVQ